MLSVIIPMYNEKSVISSTIQHLTEALEETTVFDQYEIILSDDGSTDGCAETARKTIAELTLGKGTVHVLRAEKNAGKGAAVRLGMLAAKGDILLFTDSDLAYGCDAVVQMAEKLAASEAQILIGSRAIHPDGYAGYTPLRKIASKTFIRLLALTAGFSCSDSQCGIKAFRCEAARSVFSRCEVNGWAFDFEVLLLAHKLGYRVEEYPVTVLNHRESKVHLFRDAARMLRDTAKIKKRVNSLHL